MAWSGRPITVTPADIRHSLKTLADELGMIVTCPCGAARWCPSRGSLEDSERFWAIHEKCRPRR